MRGVQLELGYRYSDYDPNGGRRNVQGACSIGRVNDHLRVRGGRQIANRAPNIGELFEARVRRSLARWSVLAYLCYASRTTGGALSANRR